VLDGGAGRGDEDERDRLTFIPRIGELDRSRAQPLDRRVTDREVSIRVVDQDLSDRHRVRPVVADRQLDASFLEHGPFDDDVLDGGDFSQLADRVEHDETDGKQCDEDEGAERAEPRRQARSCRRGSH
jgi:hypothetical protein